VASSVPDALPPDDAAGKLPEDPADRAHGKARTVNRYAICTRSPWRHPSCLDAAEPTSSTASTPRLGSASRTGSNAPAHPPTAICASRSVSLAARKRSVSYVSRPSVLTTVAPSKLSCATVLTSPRSCWARVASGRGGAGSRR
jgi:hypothetical protein